MPSHYRKKHPHKSPYLVVIAIEDAKAEWCKVKYFDLFNSSKVKIELIPNRGNQSSPDEIFNNLKNKKNKDTYDEKDQFWLSVDFDRWGKKLAKIKRLCEDQRFGLAISNPCFELWLILHLQDHTTSLTSKECKTLLGNTLNRYPDLQKRKELFENNLLRAIDRAKGLDSGKPFPDNPGSHIYKLINAIQKLKDPN
jgi:RloB-like protein